MQASAVMALHRAGAMSQADLGRAVGMERANVHGLIARMQKLGLIDAAPHPTDARAVHIRLSEEGERSAERIARASAASAEATLDPLTPAERATLLALLARIAP